MTPNTESGTNFRDNLRTNLEARKWHTDKEVAYRHKSSGKTRKIDIVAYGVSMWHQGSNRVIAIEAKYQEVAGSKEEQWYFALQDLEEMLQDDSFFTHAAIIVDGNGYDVGVLQDLKRRANKVKVQTFEEYEEDDWWDN